MIAFLREAVLQLSVGPIRDLFRAGAPPGPELAALGRELGLRIRQVDTSGRTCFVAGFLRPTAFVGAELPGLLSDGELRAVLMHERAHARTFDTAWLMVLAVLGDLRPLGGGRALKAFLAGLERLADAAALRECAPSDLAAGILRLGGRTPASDLALPAADPAYVHWRLGHLLAEDSAPPRPAIGLLLAAAAAIALAAWPAAQLYLRHLYCQGDA